MAPKIAKLQETDETLASAADLFHVMSAPMRLKIIYGLCKGEKNVSQLLDVVQTSQPNMSQHLKLLFRAGILGKRRAGTQIFYRVQDERIVAICNVICRHQLPLP